MSTPQYLKVSTDDRIAIERLSCGVVATLEHRKMFSLWQSTHINGAGATRLGALQDLERRIQRTAAAVSGTFAAEARK